MPIVSVSPAGAKGIVKDIRPAELDPQVWSDGRNVQFQQGAVISAPDSSLLFDPTPVQFNWAFPAPVTSSGAASWLLGGNTSIYAYISGTLTDVTRVSSAYGGSIFNRWSGGVLSGVTVANNTTDTPQTWMSADSAVKLIDLPNWPSSTRAGCLRSYKQYLIALDITKSGVRYPTTVKWSHPADPGAVPISWDETDPTRDAGEYPLSETSGFCIDCVPLRDVNVIYKQDSVWGMQYIGGTYIFKFYKMFGDFGVPVRDCVVEFISGKHFVFTGTDLIIHDGQTSLSVADGKIRKLLKSLTIKQLRTCYVNLNTSSQEVWFCLRLREDDVQAADTAYVYNWVDGSIGIRELPNLRFIANGRLDPPVTGLSTWATVSNAWADHTEEWGEAMTVPAVIRMIGLGELNLQWLEAVPQTTGRCWLERTYLGVPMQTGKPPDLSVQKFAKRFWPRFTGQVGTVIRITLGTADSVATPILWRESIQFIIGVDTHVDCTLAGKMFAIRIESTDVAQWTYNGMDAEVQAIGKN